MVKIDDFVDIIDQIPVIPKSEFPLRDQLGILLVVGSRIGLFDAVDATRQLISTDKIKEVKYGYGCHCDVDDGEQPMDDCVIDTGNIHDCIFAGKDIRKEQCEYWKIIKNK